MTTSTEQTIHIIYDSAGDCVKLTSCDEIAKRASAAQYTVALSEPVIAAGLETELANWIEVLGDQDWQCVAPHWNQGLAQAAVHSGRFNAFASPIYESNPLDLPITLALRRLEGLNAHGTPADVTAMIELTEIVMAQRHGRPINTYLFSQHSLNGGPFHQSPHSDGRNVMAHRFRDLQKSVDKLKLDMDREMKTKGFVGDDAWERLSRTLSLNSIKMNETAFLMAEQESLGELFSFHDLWTEFEIDQLDPSVMDSGPSRH